jgi:hypothetical protein
MDEKEYEEILSYLRFKKFPETIRCSQRGNYKKKLERYRLHTELKSTAAETEILVKMRNGQETAKNAWRILPRRSKLEEVLHQYHVVVENGVEAHVGRDRMRPAIFEKYWWPDGATEDIQGYCKSCVECSKTTPCLLKPPLQAIIAKHRRARCQFDLVEFPVDPDTDYRYLLDIINCHTKFAWSFALKTKEVSREVVDVE